MAPHGHQVMNRLKKYIFSGAFLAKKNVVFKKKKTVLEIIIMSEGSKDKECMFFLFCGY